MIIHNVHIENSPETSDVKITDGVITAIGASLQPTGNDEVIDARGGLLIPPFVDPHVHLDAALTAGDPEWNETGTLFDGIRIWSERKKTLTVEDVKDRARRTLLMMAKRGIQYVRTHVDVTDPSLTALHALLELRDEIEPYVTLQIVAFPQEGILSFPHGKDLMREAVEEGADVVGGIPHFEFTADYGAQSLRFLMDLAERNDRLVDVHCDEIDDPASRNLETLATLGAQTLLRLEASAEARQTLISMEAERLRHSLIQSLSHDLRTPITMLKVAAEGLVAKLRGGRNAGALETAESLLEGSTRMERLVANLLEMARLQTGAIQLSRCWIPAEELFGTALAEQGERLRGYRVKTEVDPECPLVYGDEVLLVRVLSNLLDNAVKYCPEGSSILLSARRRGDLLALTVADNGPGLPDGDPQRLFDPFRRGRKEASVAGVGLGLAICRTIARAHDAQIYATSSSMGGAAFTLMLPMVPLEEALDDEEVVLARGRVDADEPLDPPLTATVCDKTASTVRAALGKIVVKKQNSDNKTVSSGGSEPTEEVEAGGGRP